MKGKLEIKRSENIKRTKFYFEDGVGSKSTYNDWDYYIEVIIPIDKKIDFLKIKQSFYKFIKRKVDSKQYNEDYPYFVDVIKKIINNGIDFIDNCNYIQIDESSIDLLDDIINYFDNDKLKIIIKDAPVYSISTSSYEEARKKYHNHQNVLIKIDGNKDMVTLKEYKKTVDKIENIVNLIKSHNLSPFEQIIYAYDYTKNRYCVKEKEGESPRISRDLTSSLLGDKIVCEGYATIFSTILKLLGFQTSIYSVETDSEYHANNIVRIKDDKYGLNGIYYFDPTFDRKIKDEEYETSYSKLNSLNRYNFCGNIFIEDYCFDITFGNLCLWADEELLYMLENEMYIHPKYKNRIMEFINIYNFANGNCNLYNYNEQLLNSFMKDKKDFINNFNKKELETILSNLLDEIKIVDNNTLLRAIYNARKAEYYDNPSEYSFTISDFFEIIRQFNDFSHRDYDRIDVLNFIDEKSKDIERVRFTKVLSNISKKR